MHTSDDRTEEQAATHRWLAIGTDRFLSGWGLASGGTSVAAWACETRTEAEAMAARLRTRGDMLRVRVVYDGPRRYRPRGGCAHFHVYLSRHE